MKNRRLLYKMVVMIGCVTFCAILSGCGIPKPPEEKQVLQDLPMDINIVTIDNPYAFDDNGEHILDIQSLTITKRQTNEKEDAAWCDIEMEDSKYHVTKHLMLNYTYYDKGGWMLDGYSPVSEDEWELLSFPSFVEDAQSSASEAFALWFPDDFTEISEDRESKEAKVIIYINEIETTIDGNTVSSHKNGRFQGEYCSNYSFANGIWTKEIVERPHFLWNIPQWSYYKVEAGLFSGTEITSEVNISFDTIDNEQQTLTGNWRMSYNNPSLGVRNRGFEKALPNDEDGISFNESSITLTENINSRGAHSYIKVNHDTACANFMHDGMSAWGEIDLSTPDLSSDSYSPERQLKTMPNSSASNEEKQRWVFEWSQYLRVAMGSRRWETIEKSEGDYLYLISLLDNEIVKIERYSENQKEYEGFYFHNQDLVSYDLERDVLDAKIHPEGHFEYSYGSNFYKEWQDYWDDKMVYWLDYLNWDYGYNEDGPSGGQQEQARELFEMANSWLH